jgi:hypothetical protein
MNEKNAGCLTGLSEVELMIGPAWVYFDCGQKSWCGWPYANFNIHEEESERAVQGPYVSDKCWSSSGGAVIPAEMSPAHYTKCISECFLLELMCYVRLWQRTNIMNFRIVSVCIIVCDDRLLGAIFCLNCTISEIG